MRVVVISDYAVVTGGAAKIAVESALLLADAVAHVHFISGGKDIAAELSQHPNVTVTSVGGDPLGKQSFASSLTTGMWNLNARNTVDKVLQSYDSKDTIVAIHSWRDILTASIMKPIYDGGFKFAVTLHDYGMVCPLAGLYDHKSNTICDRRALSAACLTRSCTNSNIFKKSYFSVRHATQSYVGKIPQRVENVVVVSDRSREIVAPRLDSDTKYYEVPNPIVMEKGERVEAEKNQAFVYVGRLSPEKGPALAAAAAKLAGVPISFGGSGIEEATIIEINPEAIMHGWLSKEEVKTLLRSARALIFPSVWYECQGMVVDEAAAMGVPAIVSDVTTATTALNRYQHGVTFQSGDVESLAQRIREFADDEVVRNYSKEGHSRFWADPPDQQAHLQKLLSVYEELLSS